MEWMYLLSGAVGLAILGVFVCLGYYDIRYQKLPNSLIVLATILVAVFSFLTEIIIEQKSYSTVIIEHILALFPITGFYLIVYVASKGRLIGLGDVKLGIPIGLLLSWRGALLTMLLANMLAFLILLPCLITKKIKSNTKIPFGPFLIVSGILVFFTMKFFVDFF